MSDLADVGPRFTHDVIEPDSDQLTAIPVQPCVRVAATYVRGDATGLEQLEITWDEGVTPPTITEITHVIDALARAGQLLDVRYG